MTFKFGDGARRSRRRPALAAVVAVLLLGLLVAAATEAHSHRPTKTSSAHRERNDLERFDLVGENHPGPVRVSLGTAAFPNRTLFVTVPSGKPLSSATVHVFENGQSVHGVTLGSSAGMPTSDRYIVRYVSSAPADDREVELSVTVDGVGVRDIDYSSRQGRSLVVTGGAQSFWGSGRGLVTMSLLAALLIAVAVTALLAARRRRSVLRERVGEYTAPALPKAAALASVRQVTRLPRLERLLQRMSWWPSFTEKVEIAGFSRPAVELVAITAAVSVSAAFLIGAAVGSAAVWLLVLPLGPFVLRAMVRQRLGKQRHLFSEQLAAHLQELASAMRAGHGLASALAVMAQSATEPSRGEWSRAVADEQLGKPLDAAMHSMATRMDCSDIEQVALVAALHHRTGGNMAEVLERVADGVRERADLQRQLTALTAQARLSRWVVTALPPALIGVITLIDHAYMRPLFTTSGGFVMLGIATTLLILGSLVMRKLTDIKV